MYKSSFIDSLKDTVNKSDVYHNAGLSTMNMRTWYVGLTLFTLLGLGSCAPYVEMQSTEPMPYHAPNESWRHWVSVSIQDFTTNHFMLGNEPLDLHNKSKAIRETVQNQLMRYNVNYVNHSQELLKIEVRQFDVALSEQTYSCTIRLDIQVVRNGWVAYDQEVIGQSNSLNVVNSGVQSAIYSALEQAMENTQFDQVAQAFDVTPYAPMQNGGIYIEQRQGYVNNQAQNNIIRTNSGPSTGPYSPTPFQPAQAAPVPKFQPTPAQKISKSIEHENMELMFLGLHPLNAIVPADPIAREQVKESNRILMEQNKRTMENRAAHGDRIALQWLKNHGYAVPPKPKPLLNNHTQPVGEPMRHDRDAH